MIEQLLRLTRLAMRLPVFMLVAAMGQIALPVMNAGFEEGSLGAMPSGWLSGDYNQDSVVNLADYSVWRDSLGATGLDAFALADGNGDGEVTAEDYEVWRHHFGTSLVAPNSSNASGDSKVPEPQSANLIAVTATLFLLHRRNHARSHHE
jgi:hypothetical protein